MDGRMIDGKFSHPQQSCTVSVTGENTVPINDRTAACYQLPNGACELALMVHDIFGLHVFWFLLLLMVRSPFQSSYW
jgi:hypothetical protein